MSKTKVQEYIKEKIDWQLLTYINDLLIGFADDGWLVCLNIYISNRKEDDLIPFPSLHSVVYVISYNYEHSCDGSWFDITNAINFIKNIDDPQPGEIKFVMNIEGETGTKNTYLDKEQLLNLKKKIDHKFKGLEFQINGNGCLKIIKPITLDPIRPLHKV